MAVSNDHTLCIALSSGDERTFDSFFRSNFVRVKLFITKLCGDEEEAANMAQNVFLHLWLHREQLGTVLNLDAYLFATARHEVFSFLRHKVDSAPIEEVDTDVKAGDGDTWQTIACNELEQFLAYEIDKMPAQRQRIFRMSRYEGKSNQEIADELGISKRTVETHISLALETLRKLLTVLSIIFMSH